MSKGQSGASLYIHIVDAMNDERLLAHDGDEPGSTRTKHHISRADTILHNWWLWESLSAVLGILAVVALYEILRAYDQQLVPQWNLPRNTTITLNTVVSILSTVIRGSLLLPIAECISQLKWSWYSKKQRPLADFAAFDSASRGSWGGAQLLWRLRFWYVFS